MTPDEFSPQQIPRGARARLQLDVTPLPTGGPLQLTVLAAQGLRPGKTLVVLGGVHGDEYEGMAAVRAVFQALDPAEMSGTFLGLPLCNPLAFAARTRNTPQDGLNMARVFPGRADGALTERLAHAVTVAATNHADFLIDLHSSGSHIAMPLFIGCYQADNAAGRASTEAARRFGLPVVWYHGEGESESPGRSMSEPHTRGVPWLYTESPSGGWLHQDVAGRYAQGVLNVMRFLGMLPGEAPLAALETELFGEGNIDLSLTSPASGFLVPNVELLEKVEAGHLLGTVLDPSGDLLAELRAPAAGTVVLRRNSASVLAGEIAFLLT